MSEQRINTTVLVPDSFLLDALRNAVNTAGADWVGVQQSFLDGRTSIDFISHETGSRLSVSIPLDFSLEQLCTEIKEKLAADQITFGNRKISVRASVLESIRSRVSEIETEIREVLGDKHGKTNS